QLRRSLPAPAADVSVDFDEDARWLVLSRGPLTLAANLGQAAVVVPVGAGKVVLASSDATPAGDGRSELAPESAIVLLDP
ncbi:MAG TPA: DUF3459 domain-containing protein, partial [Acidimicrobiales bacterium]|nr:DUF3459 domain-containing protein [Acidimicrobiales bacterium]